MKKRDSFGTRLGFIMVSAGCAIGIGNVWKFPFITGQNGGAFFVLFYLIFLVIFCFSFFQIFPKNIKLLAYDIITYFYQIKKNSCLIDNAYIMKCI